MSAVSRTALEIAEDVAKLRERVEKLEIAIEAIKEHLEEYHGVHL